MEIRVANGMERDDITLPMGDADLTDRMERIGIEDIRPKCKFVTSLSGESVIDRLAGQIVDMDEVNYLVKRMESLTEYEKEVMTAFAEEKKIDSAKDLINLTFSLSGLSLLTDFTDKEKVGRQLYLDEFLGVSVSEDQKIDYAGFLAKTLKEGRVRE